MDWVIFDCQGTAAIIAAKLSSEQLQAVDARVLLMTLSKLVSAPSSSRPSQGKHRVNIVSPKKNPSDPSGGFILEFTHSENPKGLATVNGTKYAGLELSFGTQTAILIFL